MVPPLVTPGVTMNDPKHPNLFGHTPPARRPSSPAAKPPAPSTKKPPTTQLGPSKRRLAPVTRDLFDTRVWSKYQNAVFEAVETTDDNLAILARAGTGKCLGLGTPVMLADGRVIPVEEVKTGDLLMGPDSEPRRVLGTNRGRGPLYRIVPVKGEPWICNDVHVLTLAGSNHNMGKVIDIPLNEHLAASAAKGERPDRSWKLWRVGVNFPERPLPIEPYLLGLWLGDGTLAAPHITNADPEIQAYCREAASRHKVELTMMEEKKNNTWRLSFRVPNGEGSRANRNPLWGFLQRCVCDGEKFIPQEFLCNGRQQRLELLAGLIDTDGFFSTGGYEIAFKPKRLAEQVLYLARSLGLAAYMTEKEGTCKTNKGTFRGTYQRVFISGDVSVIPCKVARKKASPRRQIKRVNVTGFEVESLGEGEYAGFELDRDGRFLLGDFTVTHNTTILEEITKRLPGDKTVLVVAFNKSIAEELKTRVRGGCDVMTTNGLGHRAVMNAFGSKKPEADKWVRRMLREHYFPARTDASKRTAIAQMVGRAKNSLLKEPHEIRPLIDKLKIDPCILLDDSEISLLGREAAEADGRRRLVGMVQTVLGRCQKMLPTTDIIDYDDQLWAPNLLNLAVGTWDIVLVDEAQDLNVAQMELIARAMGPHSRIIVVGDPRQCHPAGVLVDVGGGKQVPIEQLADGQRVRGWNQNVQRMLPDRPIKVSSRPYRGPLYHVTVPSPDGPRTVPTTPNHRFVARWAERGDQCVTYLMFRKGFGYRVGWCKLFTTANGETSFHLAQRARIEKADAVWILKVHASRTEASVHESIVAARYGLPTATFEPVDNANHQTAEAIASIFAALSDTNIHRGQECLRDHGRDADYPLYPWPHQEVGKPQGRRTIFEVFASNLEPGLMSVPLPDGEKMWVPVESVRIEPDYEGLVYSLEVEKDHSYAANGIVVLNSIYGFRGADPNAFQKLVDRFKCRVLPLPVTYRCGHKIVAEAKRLVPDFEAGPNNPEGEVLMVPKLEVDLLEPGDFVISRKNAPLVELCFRAIAQGKPAMLAGRDLGRELRRQVEDAEEKAGGYAPAETVMNMVLADIDRQVKLLGEEEEDFGDLLDRRDCIVSLFRAKGSVDGVKEALDCLFDDGDKLKGKVVFCSAHRSKGLEANRVWLLSSTFHADRSYEEGNLLYVATTRAILTLFYVAEQF